MPKRSKNLSAMTIAVIIGAVCLIVGAAVLRHGEGVEPGQGHDDAQVEEHGSVEAQTGH